jgi:hypothetical protein
MGIEFAATASHGTSPDRLWPEAPMELAVFRLYWTWECRLPDAIQLYVIGRFWGIDSGF